MAEIQTKEGQLIEILRKGGRKERVASALELGRLKVRDAVPALIEALNEGEPALQINAALALWMIAKIKDGLPTLLDYLRSTSEDFRTGAALALKFMGQDIATDLTRILEEDPSRLDVKWLLEEIKRKGRPNRSKTLLQ